MDKAIEKIATLIRSRFPAIPVKNEFDIAESILGIYKSLGYVQLDKDQSLPEPSRNMSSDGQELYGEIMLNARFRKVVPE